MLFLKKFYAYGFKSFANEITINFENQMTGIVGPNGSGKSNIIDALKWVLGEQSNKEIRGRDKYDLIFNGTDSFPKAKFAQVTLTFNNQNKVLNYDKNEITVTRKLYRDTGENEYYINNEIAKLKDIQRIFVDTGLSKGSLGIISQGSVSNFSESKPVDRRKIFEDAAGIGIYSIRKKEALRVLERSENSLNTILATEKELEKSLKKLSKEAENAKIFMEKFEKLKELDLTISVKDLKHFTINKDRLQSEIKILEEEKNTLEPIVSDQKSKLDFIKQKLSEADATVTEENENKIQLKEKINSLEKKRAVFNSKLEQDISSDNIDVKLKAYETLILTNKNDAKEYKNSVEELELQIETYESVYKGLTETKETYNDKITSLVNSYTENNTKLNIYNNQIANSHNNKAGVRTILENKDAVKGVYDVVSKFIDVEDKYEVAITKALAKSVDSIIVETTENAINAVKFLKKNKGGQATFLPLKDISSRYVKQEHLDVLTELEGFLGIASKLIKTDPKVQPVIDALIGQIIISDTIESATRISKFTHQIYKVISLDGNIVFPGGAITGGSEEFYRPVFNLEKQRDELQTTVRSLAEEISKTKLEFEKITIESNEVNVKIQTKQLEVNSWKVKLDEKEQYIQRYTNEYESISKKSFDSGKQIDENELQQEINSLQRQEAKIEEALKIANTNKITYASQVNELENQLEDARKKLDKIKNQLSDNRQDELRANNAYENIKNRINEKYTMTVEFALENFSEPLPISDDQARTIINQLNAEIDSLGKFNPNAIEELTEKQERYDQISINRKQTEESIRTLKLSISELDKSAKVKFSKVIEDVNSVLPEIFKYLFGGGTCAVRFSDPEDILTSGIEVIAHPPGKKHSNLNLLSGGEKTLVAISVLFSILKISSFPLVILDEAEAALDNANVDRYAKIIKDYSEETQFLIVTHRSGSMKECPILLGATMQTPGITNFYSVTLEKAIELAEKDEE
ncbi:MAG: AAA family ATPase [Mycoplasma sp.]